MQPNGWGVVGIHTNFYATGDAHVVTGTLLGQPASVRFTPIAWHWDYGDGTASTVRLPRRHVGATGHPRVRRDAGQPPVHRQSELHGDASTSSTPPSTSTPASRGVPIAGTLLLSANDLAITTWNVKTVLVAEDCLDDPSGPGCPGG